MEERSSGFVVYCLEEGEPLYLLLRSSGSGNWGLPKGHVDQGETDEQAARRELAEESGITDFKLQERFEQTIAYWFTRSGKKIHKTVRYFLARVESRDTRISPEHSESGWFTLKELKDKIVFANLRGVIEEADRFIRAC